MVTEGGKMKWEYLQVYLNRAEDGTLRYLAFDGASACDGDKSLIKLLNRLGADRWEYCEVVYITSDLTSHSYHLLKRSLP